MVSGYSRCRIRANKAWRSPLARDAFDRLSKKLPIRGVLPGATQTMRTYSKSPLKRRGRNQELQVILQRRVLDAGLILATLSTALPIASIDLQTAALDSALVGRLGIHSFLVRPSASIHDSQPRSPI